MSIYADFGRHSTAGGLSIQAGIADSALNPPVRLRQRANLARRVDAGWREVMLANVAYDLALATMGCSTVALATPTGPVLGRNLDWWPEDILAQTSCAIRSFRDGRLAFVNAGWPGAIGASSGLSGRGFGVVVNALLCPEGSSKTGYPVLLHIRRVLEDPEDFDRAVKMLSEEKQELNRHVSRCTDPRVRWSPKYVVLCWVVMGRSLQRQLTERFREGNELLSALFPYRRRCGETYPGLGAATRRLGGDLLHHFWTCLRTPDLRRGYLQVFMADCVGSCKIAFHRVTRWNSPKKAEPSRCE